MKSILSLDIFGSISLHSLLILAKIADSRVVSTE